MINSVNKLHHKVTNFWSWTILLLYIGLDVLIILLMECKNNSVKLKYDQPNATRFLTGISERQLDGRQRLDYVYCGLVFPLVVCQAVDCGDTDQQFAPEWATLDASDRQRRPVQPVVRQLLNIHQITDLFEHVLQVKEFLAPRRRAGRTSGPHLITASLIVSCR